MRTHESSREIGRVSRSLGIAQLRWAATLDELIGRADAALYRAKELGRKRVNSLAELADVSFATAARR